MITARSILKNLQLPTIYALGIFAFCQNSTSLAQENTSEQNATQTNNVEEEKGSGIFKRIDKNGRVIFTDQAPKSEAPNVEEIELKEANYYEQLRAKASQSSSNKEEKEETAKPIVHISFTYPTDGEQIGPATKTLNVKLRANRYKPHYYQYRLYWNQQALKELSPSGTFNIPLNLTSRGKRSLYAELVDTRNMQVNSRSNTINVHVIRP